MRIEHTPSNSLDGSFLFLQAMESDGVELNSIPAKHFHGFEHLKGLFIIK